MRLVHHDRSVASACFVVAESLGSEGAGPSTETFGVVKFVGGRARRMRSRSSGGCITP